MILSILNKATNFISLSISNHDAFLVLSQAPHWLPMGVVTGRWICISFNLVHQYLSDRNLLCVQELPSFCDTTVVDLLWLLPAYNLVIVFGSWLPAILFNMFIDVSIVLLVFLYHVFKDKHS